MSHSLFKTAATIRILMFSGLIGVVGISSVQAQTPMTTSDRAGSSEPASQVPPSASQPSPPASSGDAFIDRTDYSLGATERTEAPAIVAKPTAPRRTEVAESVSAAPVKVGDFSLSARGIEWTAVEPSNPIGSAYNTVQNYFNRTIRPIGRVGNGDLKLIFPLAIPAPITSLFGWRVHPISGDTRLHTGTDLGAPMGTPVLAALTGRVIMADFFGGYGLAVALEHNAGAQQTLYAHLSEIFVKPGDIVKQGTVLGRVGSTGNSTGPHLHFEVRQQTTEGWVALDAGASLETAMAELVKSMQVAQKPQTP